jgi:UDP-3-O-[3-hydroxymyristoyl] glucosamine N-acyltransferase
MLLAPLQEKEIRRILGLSIEGNREVIGIAPLNAIEDRCLTFINKEITTSIRDSLMARQGCILIAPTGSELRNQLGDCLVLESANPRAVIAKILEFIRDEGRVAPRVTKRSIAPSAVISPLAVLEENVEIGEGTIIEPFCTVGADVVIGQGTMIKAGARIYPRVSIGAHSMIGDNAVIGTAGYGFVRDEEGNKSHIPHLGGVAIGSHAEVGALTVIQCGMIVPTVIEDHVKIGDMVCIGHNTHIEHGVSVTGAVAIGGSATIGADAWIGVNASIRNGLHIGPRALVGMDASVQIDLDENAVARSRPAMIGKRPEDDDPTSIGFV